MSRIHGFHTFGFHDVPLLDLHLQNFAGHRRSNGTFLSRIGLRVFHNALQRINRLCFYSMGIFLPKNHLCRLIIANKHGAHLAVVVEKHFTLTILAQFALSHHLDVDGFAFFQCNLTDKMPSCGNFLVMLKNRNLHPFLRLSADP